MLISIRSTSLDLFLHKLNMSEALLYYCLVPPWSACSALLNIVGFQHEFGFNVGLLTSDDIFWFS